MASTYSTNLAIELIGTGDQAGTWGNTTNTNLGTLIEQAISGYVTQAVSTGTDTTITIPNGATGVARNMYIELTGTGGASTNLIVPANKKLYFIFNNASGAVTVKVSGQTGVSVPAGKKVVLASNGTDTVNALNYIADFGSNSATITQLTATSATITNLTLTSLVISNLSIASANITTLTSASATITNLIGNSLTISSGTANGVLYLNASKVATSGSALTFDGTNLGVSAPAFDHGPFVVGANTNTVANITVINSSSGTAAQSRVRVGNGGANFGTITHTGASFTTSGIFRQDGTYVFGNGAGGLTLTTGVNQPIYFAIDVTEQMRLTSTGLGIGTASPGYRLTVSGGATSLAANQYLRFGAGIFASSDGSVDNYLFTGSTALRWRNSADSAELMQLTNSGNLGIGTSSPANKLHVVGSSATPSVRIGSSSVLSAYWDIGRENATSGDFLFNNGSTTVMTLTNSGGNLGLGVTPSAWLSGAKVFQFGSTSALSDTQARYTDLLSNCYVDTAGTVKYLTTGNATIYSQNRASGIHAWYTAASGTAGNTVSLTQAMTLDASSNWVVGGTTVDPFSRGDDRLATVNTTSASQNLALSLNAGSSAGRGAQIYMGAGGTRHFTIAANSSESTLGTVSNTPLRFTTNDTERARITSGGLFQVVATGSNSTFTDGGQISLKESGNSPYISWHQSTGARIGYLQMASGGNCNLWIEANQPLTFATNNTERARITAAGEMLVGTTTAEGNGMTLTSGSGNYVFWTQVSTTNQKDHWRLGNPNGQVASIYTSGSSGGLYNLSDQRAKKNIVDAPSALQSILDTKIRSFDWIVDDVHQEYGGIAQEFQLTIPEAVITPSDEGAMLAIDWAKPIPRLIKAIQEQQAMIKSLEAKVAALEAK